MSDASCRRTGPMDRLDRIPQRRAHFWPVLQDVTGSLHPALVCGDDTARARERGRQHTGRKRRPASKAEARVMVSKLTMWRQKTTRLAAANNARALPEGGIGR